MDPQKLVDMRRQMERNNDDISQFVKGLNSWEDKIKSPKTDSENAQEIYKKIPEIREKKSSKPDPRISSEDYKKWNNYDATKALEDIDTEEDIVTAEKRSVMLKTQGNTFYKKGDYDQAMFFYTEAIKLTPTNAILLSNRSMTLLKLERYEEAESDADAALKYDDKSVKALARRGSARLMLGRSSDAKEDFRRVLQLDPDNKPISNQLISMRKLEAEPGTVFPVSKCRRIRKPLTRIHISEIGVNEPENIKNPIIKTNSSIITETKVKDIKPKEINIDRKVPESHPVVTDYKMEVPTTSYQFERDWKIVSKDTLTCYNYLKNIDVLTFSKLFGACMNSDILSTIVEVLISHYIPDQLDCFEVLNNLRKVPRFQMTVMFLNKKVKEDLKKIFNYITYNLKENITKLDEINKLRQVYS